jgi:hypothetical protein
MELLPDLIKLFNFLIIIIAKLCEILSFLLNNFLKNSMFSKEVIILIVLII